MKNFKKFLALVLSLATICMCFTSLNMTAKGATGIFLDDQFEYYIRELIGKPTGTIVPSDVSNIKKIDVGYSRYSITSLKGIEYMTSLETLMCDGNQLTTLDVSKNTMLKFLGCYNNRLTSLDVSKNTMLEVLGCGNNPLTMLNISGCTNLQKLSSSNTLLTSLDVSGYSNLRELGCYDNDLMTSLNVNGCINLYSLNCFNSRLTSLDVSSCDNLDQLFCENNRLTSIDVSNNPNLWWLSCHDNNLTSLDVSGLTSLYGLSCHDNNLTSLDASGLTSLYTLQCHDNNLTSLDVSGLVKLSSLDCYNNNLTSLDVSGLTSIRWFECYNNQLTSLDVRSLTRLERLDCSYNNLKNVDILKGTRLTTFIFDPQNPAPDTIDPNDVRNVTVPFSAATDSFKYNGDEFQYVHSTTVKWGNGLFACPSTIYNHDLATASMALSAASYNTGVGYIDGVIHSDELIREAMDNMDLKNVKTYRYNDDAPDKVAFAIGNKKLLSDTTLIVVSIRGTHGSEWYDDFIMTSGKNKVHPGFDKSAREVYNELCKYTAGCIDAPSYANGEWSFKPQKFKVLITGHSRGAAAANILAARVTANINAYINEAVAPLAANTPIYENADITINKEDIYAYTFATPNVTNSTDTQSGNFNNIYNFVNPEDFVPYMPLAAKVNDWGYWKFGRTFAFPTKGISVADSSYEQKYEAKLKTCFKDMTTVNLETYAGGFGEVQHFAYNLQQTASSVYDYNNHYYALTSGPMSTREYFLTVAGILTGDLGNSDMARWFTQTMLVPEFKPITKFLFNNGTDLLGSIKRMMFGHAPETYLAWMKTIEPNDLKTNIGGKYARIACPVDVEVYDSKGVLVGRVENNILDESIESDVFISVEGDVKHVYMPQGEAYSLKLIGTDIGSMDYSVESIDSISGESIEEKKYSRVPLFDGKEMRSEIADIPTTNLLVIEDGNIVGEIQPDLQLGDLNGDEKIDVMDIMIVRNYILGITNLSEVEVSAADVNRDSKVNLLDIMCIRKLILSSIQ